MPFIPAVLADPPLEFHVQESAECHIPDGYVLFSFGSRDPVDRIFPSNERTVYVRPAEW